MEEEEEDLLLKGNKVVLAPIRPQKFLKEIFSIKDTKEASGGALKISEEGRSSKLTWQEALTLHHRAGPAGAVKSRRSLRSSLSLSFVD